MERHGQYETSTLVSVFSKACRNRTSKTRPWLVHSVNGYRADIPNFINNVRIWRPVLVPALLINLTLIDAVAYLRRRFVVLGHGLDSWPVYMWSVVGIGARSGRVVKALRYKPAGRVFDSRWCHGNFSVTYSFRSHYGPGVDSASNGNEYQMYFLGVKAAGA